MTLTKISSSLFYLVSITGYMDIKLDFSDSLPFPLFFANPYPLIRESGEKWSINTDELEFLERSFSLDSTRCKPILLFPNSRDTSVFENKHLSDVSPKDKIWNKHRASSDLVRDTYLRLGYERHAERITQCSKILEFAKVLSKDELAYKLKSARFCRHRHCIVCQWRRTLKWNARFFKAMPNILRDYPKHRFIFLTLTIKNCDITDLRDTINLMNIAWKRLIQRKNFPAEGFVKSLEVTKGKDDLAHPHFHILMMVPGSYFSKAGGYLSHEKWKELWKKSLRISYEPTVNIKSVSSKGKGSLIDALRETLKYSLKPEDLIVDTKTLKPAQVKDKDKWLGELTKQLHKVRAVSLGGIFKNYLSDEELNDLINIDEESDGLDVSEERYFFDWIQEVKEYIQRRDI